MPRTPFLLVLLKVAFGIYINVSKSDLSVTTEKEFLGMTLNSKNQTVTIPDQKWWKFNLQCRHLQSREYVLYKDMEKLRGTAISFLIVVNRAKLHIRRMTEVLTKYNDDQSSIPMTKRLAEELDFWINLPVQKRTAPWFTTLPRKEPILVFTDSSMNAMGFVIMDKYGKKIVEDTEYFNETWQPKIIAVKEALAIIRLLERYPDLLRNKLILSMCDNQNVYYMFQSDGSRTPELNDLFRRIYFHLEKLDSAMVPPNLEVFLFILILFPRHVTG